MGEKRQLKVFSDVKKRRKKEEEKAHSLEETHTKINNCKNIAFWGVSFVVRKMWLLISILYTLTFRLIFCW